VDSGETFECEAPDGSDKECLALPKEASRIGVI
jgi:hypothetical protein